MGPAILISRAIVMVAVMAALTGCAAASVSVASSPVASNAFSYACAAGGDCGAFMTITNQGSQANSLVAVTTTVTDRAELHAMAKDAKGDMTMTQVDNIAVPAAGAVSLKPGSYHVMLFGLTKELKVGDTFPLTLKYEQGGENTIQVQVQEKN